MNHPFQDFISAKENIHTGVVIKVHMDKEFELESMYSGINTITFPLKNLYSLSKLQKMA